LQRPPIYEALAVQDGIHLPTAEARQQHGQRRVARVLRAATESLPADITVQEGLQGVRASKFRTWLIADQRGVVGVISLSTLEQAAGEDDTKKLNAIVDPLIFPHVHADQGLDLALDRMGSNHVEILPVVSRADVHKLEGIVTLRDVLDSYGISPTDRAYG
jgi:CIC family chloride channel protein